MQMFVNISCGFPYSANCFELTHRGGDEDDDDS